MDAEDTLERFGVVQIGRHGPDPVHRITAPRQLDEVRFQFRQFIRIQQILDDQVAVFGVEACLVSGLSGCRQVFGHDGSTQKTDSTHLQITSIRRPPMVATG